MGIFNFLKKASVPSKTLPTGPYQDSSTNLIYNLLFCDDLALYREQTKPPYSYPFDILFSEPGSATDLQRIIDDQESDPRIKVLAYNRQVANGQQPVTKELLAVIVEVGLDAGLDVLASFQNGTARYINQTGKILIWENTTDESANAITHQLFTKSQLIVDQIGAWDKPRRPFPEKGIVRISFLVSDGLYFGEGALNTFFRDPMAGPALAKATELMQYLTNKSMNTGS